jgi:hypothetical protein
MKTVLAPNAPWPKVEPIKPKPKKKRPYRHKYELTDAKFEAWLAKNPPVK